MPRARTSLAGLLLAGLSACTAVPEQVDTWLRGCAPRYSEAHRMLGRTFAGPGYHSTVPDGTWVHPTLDSLDYALALLTRGSGADVRRAAGVLDAVLDLQQTDPEQEFHGLFPWLREEPVATMAPPDKNWADFCGARIAQILCDHDGALDAALRSRLRLALLHAARAIQRRDVGPGYTNIAIMGSGVAVAAGELLGDQELIDYGRRKLRAVLSRTGPEEQLEEYNSPTYTTVALLECERVLHTVRDPATRRVAERLRRIAWHTIAASFHPATGQWAGPHSRAYADRLDAWQVRVLAARLDHPLGTPPLCPHPEADRQRGDTFVPTPALPCPAELRARFFALPAPTHEVRRAFVVDPDAPHRARTGTTWFADDACLGSVDTACLWAQRRAVLGYWRTDADPAVVLRLRALHDGRDCAALGVRSAQRAQRVLSVLFLRSDRGDWHHHLDPPEDAIYRARDLRVRWELRGAGVGVRELPDGRYALVAGGCVARIHTRPGRFFGAPVLWRAGTADGVAFVEAVLYEGPERAFAFTTPGAIRLATAVELVAAAAADRPPELVVAEEGDATTARWAGLLVAADTHVADPR